MADQSGRGTSRSTEARVPVGTRVITRWGPAVVIRDHWPTDPNYVIEYLAGAQHAGVDIAGLTGAFTSVYPDPREARYA